jgi:phospholipid/cholesterol/gamma-HCH transport system permease protein
MYGANPSGLDEYARTVARVFSPWAIAGFMLKSFLFGAAVAVIPIAAGLDATRDDPASVPEAVMGGMVRLFVTLALIELLSLAVKYV